MENRDMERIAETMAYKNGVLVYSLEREAERVQEGISRLDGDMGIN
jgi:hypothetical protein